VGAAIVSRASNLSCRVARVDDRFARDARPLVRDDAERAGGAASGQCQELLVIDIHERQTNHASGVNRNSCHTVLTSDHVFSIGRSTVHDSQFCDVDSCSNRWRM